MNWMSQLSLFTLGFSSLFPLINPIGTALILNPYFAQMPLQERKASVRSITLYCLLLGLGALFAGSWCLRFMGISVPTTQLAGGLIIARMGLQMLNADPQNTAGNRPPEAVQKALFYPMSFPLTIGPGGISVLITLSAHAHASSLPETFFGMGVIAASLLAVMLITYLCFVYSDQVIKRIGSQGSLVMDRLMSFLVFCIGLQLALSGLMHIFPQISPQP